jgi:hypothetical protein
MGPFLKEHGLAVGVSLVAIYLIFFLSLGTRTLFQHVVRIARTPEAQELGQELVDTAASATHTVKQRFRGGATDY